MKKYYCFKIVEIILFFIFSISPVLAYSKEDKTDDKVYVDIKGEVKNPGVYEVDKNMIVNQVIEKAGGLTKNADTEYLNLSKRVKDEMVIIVYSKKEITTVKKQEKVAIQNKTTNKTKEEVVEEKSDEIPDEIIETSEIDEEIILEDNVITEEKEQIDKIENEESISKEQEVIEEENQNKQEEKDKIQKTEETKKVEENQKEEVKREEKSKLTEVKGKSTGIDISKYQGNINFDKVKQSGIDFVMIRVGYRGYETGVIKEDSYFKKNIKEAIKAGLKVGVYFFSTATTKKEALEEAKFTVDKIKDYDITYPVAIDYETFDARCKKLTKERRTNYVIAFLDYVNSKGYQGMFYSYKSAFESKFQMERLTKYKIWLAHFVNKTNYQGKYDMWQYTSSGTLAGISGKVDKNIANFRYV